MVRSSPEGREPGCRSRFVQAFALRFFAALLFVLPLPAQDQETPSQEFDLTLAGDSMITQPISVRKGEPRIMAVDVEKLLALPSTMTGNVYSNPSLCTDFGTRLKV